MAASTNTNLSQLFPFPAKRLSDSPPNQLPKPHQVSFDALLNSLQAITNGRRPAKSSFISAISTCSSNFAVSAGKSIHAVIVKTGFGSDRFVASSLIGFYASCGLLCHACQVFDGITHKDVALHTAMLSGYVDNGELERARVLFDEMPERDAIAWNAIISGYAQHGLPEDALGLFQEMQVSMVLPDEVTLISVLSASSKIGCLAMGEWIHAYIDRHLDVVENPSLNNALVHMYAKCGRLDAAFRVFLEKEPKNLESWNTMLTSFAVHGCGSSALSLFSQMIKLSLPFDHISFIGALMACSHAGLVNHAWSCFNFMTRACGFVPKVEHYGCLVDVLSRRGYLEEARMVIQSMPFEQNAGAWGALLNGCFSYCNYELGLEAARYLIELDPWNEGRYTALLNVYAMIGRVQDAMTLRKLMAKMGINQPSGRSSIEVDGVVHEFLAGDRSHPCSKDIYLMAELISSILELYG